MDRLNPEHDPALLTPAGRRADRWLWLAGMIVLLDQLSKWLVLSLLRPGDSIYVAPFFNWVLTYNPGAAFSFLSDAGGWQRWFFTLLALIVSGWIVSTLRRHEARALRRLRGWLLDDLAA